MEILPRKVKSKERRKQVRFTLPESVDESVALVQMEKKNQDVKSARKVCTKKTILRKFHPYLEQKKIEPIDEKVVSVDSIYRNQSLNKTFCVTDAIHNEEMLVSGERHDTIVMDRNENCKVRSKCSKVTKRYVPIRKSKSDDVLCSKKRKLGLKPAKKRKNVVSKKLWVRKKQNSKYKQGRKRGHGDIGNSKLIQAKKRKISIMHKGKKRNKKLVNNKRQHRTNETSKKGRRHKQTLSKSSVKVKHLKKKIKKAIEKVRQSKTSKKKMMRLKKRVKKTTTKKLKLKQSVIKKRKQNKRKNEQKKRKVAKGRIVKQVKKRRRKIKIIPIERQDEVIPPLRVALLKYLTIERAYDYNLDCCRKCCWDDWEEVDMEDIKCDYD